MQTNKLSDEQHSENSATDDVMPEAEDDTMSSHVDSFQNTYDDNIDDKFSYDVEDDVYDNIAAPSQQSDKSNSDIEEVEEPTAFSENYSQRQPPSSSSSSSSSSDTAFGTISLVERWDDNDEAENHIDANQPTTVVYGTEIDHEERGNFG